MLRTESRTPLSIFLGYVGKVFLPDVITTAYRYVRTEELNRTGRRA